MTDQAYPQQLEQMITGYCISQSIYAAAKLEIADLLISGPQTAEQLATATNTDAESLYRLLRALASVGIFAENEQGEFSLTPLAEPLRSDHPESKQACAIMNGEDQFRPWCEIIYSLQTGKPAYDKIWGKSVFEFLAEHPDKAKIFDRAMTGIHGRGNDLVLDTYDFSGIQILADVGGGNGLHLTGILQANPDLHGQLFDLPHVVERAQPQIEQAGLEDRCDLVGGDFFTSIPRGPDAILMRHIIHDWNDEKSLNILRNCHAALPDQGKLLILESVIQPGNAPFWGKFVDLIMLLVTGGKERTAEDFRSLFDRAGFEMTRVIPTSSDLCIVEGIKR
ncbi:methyltransferase [Gimesia panareensis]|uniref:Multifunctional cyclase-dehydratase-3-O-methyl transferase TcmN n=1 Tax=Gimesia panareensis TaxID=2527978 RepID=A0A518ABJ7_9PLAN|nr:methyltransferase [Gimesia panareensis]QDT29193.1 Multifunctional cyclase-dehydratase-3-O-methyl transferase TcmN [Gimesia panareensis]QDU52045.1 Multifunctional cyclase-dehydratase-3-O-methyl transferase TcmN [Gimesia panareensis]